MNNHRYTWLAFSLAAVFSLCANVASAQQVKLSLGEVAHNADLIFVGTVDSQESRFNAQQTMIFTDVYFNDLDIVHATDRSMQHALAALRLTYAGGTVGGSSVEVSDTPRFVAGHRYLIFMSDDGETYASPIVGGNQGLFEVVKDSTTQQEYLLSPGGKAVIGVNAAGITLSDSRVSGISAGMIQEGSVIAPDNSVGQTAIAAGPGDSASAFRSKQETSRPVSLKEFKTAISRILLKATNDQPGSFRRDGEGVFYQRIDGKMEPQPLTLQTKYASSSFFAHDGGSLSRSVLFGNDAARSSLAPTGGALGACGYHTLPLVMEQVPASFWSFSIVNDNMYTWNVFMDLFRYTDSDGFYGNNSQNEFDAFVNDSNLFSAYGFHWNGALGITITYSSSQCGSISQSDVAWNSAYSWTTDAEFAIGNSGVILLRSVNQHETGHVWGLQTGVYTETYDYDQPTVMHAYYSSVVEDGWGIHAADAYLIRRQYQNQTGVIARKDVGVESYYASGGLNSATTNASIYSPGQSITLMGVTAENMSNTSVADMRIRFYLSANRTISTSDYQLGSYWYWTTFSPEAYNVSNYTTTIPTNIPAGTYYVGALVSVDGFGGDDYSYNNATSFFNPITVTGSGGSCTAAQMTSPANGSTIPATQTFSWNTGSGNTQYFLYVGTTGVGSSNLLYENEGTNTSKTLSSLPAGTIYVRLWSFCGSTSVWGYYDYSYQRSDTTSTGTWTPLAATPPAAMTNCLLLTDATVMCQGYFTNQWFRLTPNSSGSYINGTWTALASLPSNYRPLFFASAVLADGRVIIEGGEYNAAQDSTNPVWTNQGAIYNPTSNTWTTVSPPAGWTSIGDAMGIVLADGTFFLSDALTTKTAKFNAGSLTWTAFGTGFQAPTNDESGWTLLPDNSLLTVDATPYNSQLSERFNPTTGVWTSAGNTPVSLADNSSARIADCANCPSFEIGAGVLRPTGTVFYIGANPNIGTACCSGLAHTAVFNTATSSWSAGPNIPNSDAANDAPAAVLPSGNVLMQLSPPAAPDRPFGSPSHFYEYNGSTIFPVSSPLSSNYPAFQGGMLVLPTGQILFTHQSTDVNIYTPLGSPNAAWAPTVTSVASTLSLGSSYTISGTQFNGLTQGACYGDDRQSATNYPIVRITNTATGHVFYARTHGHSSMGVATGSTPVSTIFDVATGTELGASSLTVIANGISSAPLSVNITAAGVPAAPTASAASSISSSGFSANWSSSTGATGYRLDVSTSNTFASFVTGYQNLDVGNVLNRSVSGLSSGTTYFYRVRAYNGGGTSGNSNAVSVTTTVNPPAAPVATAATSVGSSSFTANWSSATGATGYRVDVSINNSFSSFVSGYQDLDVGNVLNRSVTGLTTATQYFYRVRAYNAGGSSSNSNTISVQTTVTTIQVTVQASPSGRTFTVDGTNYAAAQTFSWTSGSSHTIATTSLQSGAAGTQYVWTNWSDGGAISHAVTPSSATTYTASFTTQYLLTMNGGVGGTLSPSSGYFNSGQGVSISATPNSNFGFSSWTGSGAGSFTGSTNPASVTMNGPISETGSFVAKSLQLSTSAYSVNEGNQLINVSVTRTGSTSGISTVSFSTSDTAGTQNCNTANGRASSRCDYINTSGSLSFAPGESSKSIGILLIDDSYAEGSETFTIALSNPLGATLGTVSAATITIADNDSATGTNKIDQAGFFVNEHYLDFLDRTPDATGLAFWTNEITSCGSNQGCIDVKRINVSAAYFLSIEFQETGYLVERIYKASYGTAIGTSTLGGVHTLSVPIIRLNEFSPDSQEIAQGAIVGQPGWEQLLENNKVAFTSEFVQRSRFVSAYPTSITPAAFVDALFAHAGVIPSPLDRSLAINEFGPALNTADVAARARALRRVAENSILSTSESNRAFVLMQYFGYLRRNPNDSPDADFTGYDFWLGKLNQFNGSFVDAEMVKAFIVSGEYKGRFGP